MGRTVLIWPHTPEPVLSKVPFSAFAAGPQHMYSALEGYMQASSQAILPANLQV